MVGVTGAMAVGANLGMLKASNSSAVGQVNAPTQLVDTTAGGAPNTTIVDVYVTDPAAPTTQASVSNGNPSTNDGQQFAIASAGMVTVQQTANSIHLADVQAAKGWTWSMVQPTPRQLLVTLTNGGRKYQFRATLDASGAVKAQVTESTPTTVAPPAGGGSHGGDDNGTDDNGGNDDGSSGDD